jgi:hypothetical protein
VKGIDELCSRVSASLAPVVGAGALYPLATFSSSEFHQSRFQPAKTIAPYCVSAHYHKNHNTNAPFLRRPFPITDRLTEI